MMIITIERKDYNGDIDQYERNAKILKRIKKFESDNDMKSEALLGGLVNKQNSNPEKGFISIDYVIDEEREYI